MRHSPGDLLEAVASHARAAGDIAVAARARGLVRRIKPDGTPVTDADKLAEAHIRAALATLTPGLAMVGEESHEETPAPVGGRFWLVDPVDGTRGFMAGGPEFCVNIALMAAGRPVLGVIHAPEAGLTWAAAGPGAAWRMDGRTGARTPLAGRPLPDKGVDVLVSRAGHSGPRMRARLARYRVRDLIPCSSAIKFGLLAQGEADLHLRAGPTGEWDTAAGHALLLAVGGDILTWQGAPLTYGKPGYRNPPYSAHGPFRPAMQRPDGA